MSTCMHQLLLCSCPHKFDRTSWVPLEPMQPAGHRPTGQQPQLAPSKQREHPNARSRQEPATSTTNGQRRWHRACRTKSKMTHDSLARSTCRSPSRVSVEEI